MSQLKRPLTKNFYLSLTGKEPVLNNFTLYNNFPTGLMIISKLDPTSCRGEEDSSENDNQSEEDEIEIKIKFINQQASDLFEIKENDNSSKIHEQLKFFKKFDNAQTTEKSLDSVLFYKKREKEYYGTFKNQASLIYVKYKLNNEDIYICCDYYSDERKIIQNQLFQSLKFQYIATLFHELYNPINALLFMIDIDQNEDENKEYIKSNIGMQNNFSEIDESHSVITENDYDKNNFEMKNNEENENTSIKNNIKVEELYRNKLSSLLEKEKDISLLVNMIYIFLQNLILYLRINLGVNFENHENHQKQNDDNNKICKEINHNSDKKEDKEEKICENNESKNNDNIYSDNNLSLIKKNKKLNLELSFNKHLNKFSYLFNFKNIQYCNDFSYLSDKYILTDETLFFDFLGQIYSFLYYIVPKSQGFELSYSIINDNKLKILFQKTNHPNKGGYKLKKHRKNNLFILCEDKFKATSTVKTSEMTQEILYKLSELLGIKLKIMEYEDQKEDIYLTIIMPFLIDEENDILESDIDELPNDSFRKVPSLSEVVGRNVLYEKCSENSEIEDIESKKNKENKNKISINIVQNTDSKINEAQKNLKNNNMNNKKKNNVNYLNPKSYKFTPERKASFLVDEVEEKNSSEEDVSSNNEKEKEKEKDKGNNKNNINISQKNLNYSIHHSSISRSSANAGISLISNLNQNISKSPISDNHMKNTNNFKELTINYLNETEPFLIHNDINNSKENHNVKTNTNVKSDRNALTLIHQKYSTLERLKANGVEIFTESKSENKKKTNNNNKKYFSLEPINSIDEINQKDKNSINVEVDSDYFLEIENENEEEILDIESNNITNPSNYIRHNNSVLLNLNYLNNNVIFNSSPKNNKNKKLPNKPSNKTLDYYQKKSTKSKKNNKPIIQTSTCKCKDILLVDDDEFILKTSKNILKSFKLEADCAENGQECLNMIKAKQEKNCDCAKNKYKIILMDITMPVMDGIEAAKNIQKLIDENKLYDTLKIIFISAHVNLDLSAILSGIKCASDYYAKPISGAKYKSLLDKYYYSK